MSQPRMLRLAFLVGAITDAAALIPLLIPSMARILWGFDDPSGAYRFATGYAAALMLGWTALLVWAAQAPLERRMVAALTVLVVYGLVVTEIAAVWQGALPVWRIAPNMGAAVRADRALCRCIPLRPAARPLARAGMTRPPA